MNMEAIIKRAVERHPGMSVRDALAMDLADRDAGSSPAIADQLRGYAARLRVSNPVGTSRGTCIELMNGVASGLDGLAEVISAKPVASDEPATPAGE
jgi:hypothetical protein